MRNLKVEYSWVIVRLVLGFIFVYASFYKMASPGAFAHEIANFHLVPGWAINPMAIVLPTLQLICGLALVLNRGTKGASFLIFSMMIVFQIAVASALVRGLNISCGCFESGGDPVTWWNFLRDTSILLLAVAYFLRLITNKQNYYQGLWMAG